MRNDHVLCAGSNIVGHQPALMATDPLTGHRVLGFDLETTGLNSKKDRIVQYALIGCDDDGVAMHLESLVNPRQPIPLDASRIHGITDEDVKMMGDFKEHAEEIAEAMEGAIIVGHNINRFDWPFLRAEFLRAGILMPKPLAILDTLTIAKRLKVPPRHQLGILCKRFDISLENAHTAGADAAATLLLLHKMMAAHPQHFRRPVEDIPNWASGKDGDGEGTERLGPTLEDLQVVDGSHGWLRITTDGLIVARGRNKGRSISEVGKNDPRYLEWLSSAAGPLEPDALDVLNKQRD